MTNLQHTNKLSWEFLHVLDNNSSMSLKSKNCVRKAVSTLLCLLHEPVVWVSASIGFTSHMKHISDKMEFYKLNISQDLCASD